MLPTRLNPAEESEVKYYFTLDLSPSLPPPGFHSFGRFPVLRITPIAIPSPSLRIPLLSYPIVIPLRNYHTTSLLLQPFVHAIALHRACSLSAPDQILPLPSNPRQLPQ